MKKSLIEVLNEMCNDKNKQINGIVLKENQFYQLTREFIENSLSGIPDLKIKDFCQNDGTKVADFKFKDRTLIVIFFCKG